jgi:hypothetical protein
MRNPFGCQTWSGFSEEGLTLGPTTKELNMQMLKVILWKTWQAGNQRNRDPVLPVPEGEAPGPGCPYLWKGEQLTE